MNKAEDIDQLIYRELPPDRYCYIHNFILEKDKEIERLQKILRTRSRQNRKRKAKVRNLREEITNKQERLELLNSIINEFEKWLKNKIDNFDEDVKDTILHEQMTIRCIYDYLQAVKGDSSNE